MHACNIRKKISIDADERYTKTYLLSINKLLYTFISNVVESRWKNFDIVESTRPHIRSVSVGQGYQIFFCS